MQILCCPWLIDHQENTYVETASVAIILPVVHPSLHLTLSCQAVDPYNGLVLQCFRLPHTASEVMFPPLAHGTLGPVQQLDDDDLSAQLVLAPGFAGLADRVVLKVLQWEMASDGRACRIDQVRIKFVVERILILADTLAVLRTQRS